MEIGVYSFGEVPDGTASSAAQRLRDLLEEIELADQAGLDVFGVGEHHRPDFAVSAPAGSASRWRLRSSGASPRVSRH